METTKPKEGVLKKVKNFFKDLQKKEKKRIDAPEEEKNYQQHNPFAHKDRKLTAPAPVFKSEIEASRRRKAKARRRMQKISRNINHKTN